MADEQLFDSHSPMRLRLQLPFRGVPRWIWHLPKCFADLVDKPQDLVEAYKASSASVRPALGPLVPEIKPGDKLRVWSAAVETAVSQVLADCHRKEPAKHVFRALPKCYRGRCSEVVRQQAAPPRLPRAGRHGDPAAFDEDTSVLSRQRLRQWRRLRTFEQGLGKFVAGNFRGPLDPTGYPVSLRLEWLAICNATGYAGPFRDWVLQWPCFLYFPAERPAPSFISDLVSFVRFDVEALQRQHATVKAKLYKFHLQVDAKDFSAARSFVHVKPAQNPPFTCVRHCSSQEARLSRRHSYHHCTFTVRNEDWLELHSRVHFAQVQGQVTHLSSCSVTIVFNADDDCVLPHTGKLCRYQQDSSWKGVVGALMEYWSPIWNRDCPEQEADIESWPRFQQLLATCQRPDFTVPVDLMDVEAWQHVARSLWLVQRGAPVVAALGVARSCFCFPKHGAHRLPG